MKIISKTLALTALATLSLGMTQANAQTSKYGVTVTACGFDYDEENFCTDNRIKTFSEVMNARKANFDGDKIIYIFKAKTQPERTPAVTSPVYRMVVMDKKKKLVVPVIYAFGRADSAINSKGDRVKYDFSRQSNKLCFTGNIYAYRNDDGTSSSQICFEYDSQEKNLFRIYE